MKLPVKDLNILGDRYKVAVRQMEEFGQCDLHDQVIALRPDQSVDQARDTLLHEVIHAISYVYDLDMPEKDVRLLATGLRAVFTANPKFGKWVGQ